MKYIFREKKELERQPMWDTVLSRFGRAPGRRRTHVRHQHPPRPGIN